MEKVKFRDSQVSKRQSSPEKINMKYGFTAGDNSVMKYGGEIGGNLK